MTTYAFRCLMNDRVIDVAMPMRSVPSIGETSACRCDDATYRPHQMKRIVPKSVAMAEVKGTGNGPIGRSLMDRAELGRKRRANWK